MGTGSFRGVEAAGGVGLTPYPHLECRGPRKSRAIPLLTLRAFVAYEKGENLPISFNSYFKQSPSHLLHYLRLSDSFIPRDDSVYCTTFSEQRYTKNKLGFVTNASAVPVIGGEICFIISSFIRTIKIIFISFCI